MSAQMPAARDRDVMVERLHAALTALEHGDGQAWRQHVDAMLEWRQQPLVQGVVKLAQELQHALDTSLPRIGGEVLPDACSRLEHVVAMTEQASLRTLDLVDEVRALLATLGPDQAELAGQIRARLASLTEAQSYQDLTGQIVLRVVELIRGLQANLGGLVGAQGAAAPNARGLGPNVAGLDAPATTQDEANDLLAALGI